MTQITEPWYSLISCTHPWGWSVLAGLILIQIGFTIARIVDNRRRTRAEDAMQSNWARLYRSTRLISLGEMTASIAHEINQPLGAIVSNTDAAEMMWEAGSPSLEEIRAILADIHRDARRASDMVRHVTTLFRKQDIEKKLLNLNALIGEAQQFVAADLKSQGVSFDVQLAQPDPAVLASPVQLQQVFIVLMLNGVDAMSSVSSHRKTLAVRTRWQGDHEVEITVVDSGGGLSKEHSERLLEPFFSSKSNGTGPGLSIAKFIVELHGGKIGARDMPDGGACFQISLPATAWSSISEDGGERLNHEENRND